MRLVVRFVAVLVLLLIMLASFIMLLYTVGHANALVAVGGAFIAVLPWAVAGGIWAVMDPKEFP